VSDSGERRFAMMPTTNVAIGIDSDRKLVRPVGSAFLCASHGYEIDEEELP
jgi:hypothetical protein